MDTETATTGFNSADHYSALMARAQKGERAAYRVLLSEIQPIIRLYVQSKVFRADQRDDVTQDILLSIHVARDSFDPSRAFLPWMRTIAHHRLIDHYRVTRRQVKASSSEISGDSEDALLEPSVSSFSETAIAFKQEVAALSPSQKRLLNLMTSSMLTQDEIAERLGIESGNLRVQIHRLSHRIRAALE